MPDGFAKPPPSQENRVGKRHFRDRPLAKLTEHELDVLDSLGRSSALFRDHIQNALDVLGELALRELTDRDPA